MHLLFFPKLVLFFLCCAFSYIAFSQSESDFSSKTNLDFKVLESAGNSIDFKQAYGSIHLFLDAGTIRQKTHPDETYWILVDFENALKNIQGEEILYLELTTFDYGTMFSLQDGTLIKSPVGQFDANTLSKKTSASNYHSEVSFKANSLLDNRYLLFQVKRVKFLEYPKSWQFAYRFDSLQNLYTWNNVRSSIPIYIFLGIGSIMCVIMLMFFFYFKRLEFLFYSVFVFCQIIYMFSGELFLLEKLHFNDTLLKNWLLENNAIFVGIFYNLFTIFYLNLKKEYPFAYHFLKIGVYIHILILVADIFFFFTESYIGHIYALKVLRVVSFLITISFLVYLMIYNKNRNSTIFLLGAGSFVASISIYYYFNIASDPLLFGNKLFLAIGSTLEITFFAYGLVYKAFDEYLKRLNFQREAILNKNKALRAQMNPHFLFNALGSIQHLILKKETSRALTFLNKFSRLVRNILESSIEMNVSLEEEIKMLQDYLELESLRFDNAFSYEIEMDDILSIREIEIPFMITQPFVENAIVHGILPKNEGLKRLSVHFEEKKDFLICTIDDSGVGRQKAREKQTQYNSTKKSRGLEVTLSRLKTMSPQPGKLEIIDKIDENGEPIGTKVIIALPLNTHNSS